MLQLGRSRKLRRVTSQGDRTPETKKPPLKGRLFHCMVRTKRLELLQLAPLEPKSSVSTNSTTSAQPGLKQRRQTCVRRLLQIWGGRWESNPRQLESQSSALPTELRPPYCIYLFETVRQSCLMARPAGLEPATIRLEGGCSIQLSYGRSVFNFRAEVKKPPPRNT